MVQVNKRRQELTLENPGELPTVPVPPTLQWGDPGFTSTDIMLGELCINKGDGKVYTRVDGGILLINPSLTPSTTFKLCKLLSGLIDGSNREFRFDHTVEQVFWNGQKLVLGAIKNGYEYINIENTIIKMTEAPENGDHVEAYGNY